MTTLLGHVLEVKRGDDGKASHAFRGRCVGVWGDGDWLRVALEQRDGEVLVVSVREGRDRLRILPESRKVPL